MILPLGGVKWKLLVVILKVWLSANLLVVMDWTQPSSRQPEWKWKITPTMAERRCEDYRGWGTWRRLFMRGGSRSGNQLPPWRDNAHKMALAGRRGLALPDIDLLGKSSTTTTTTPTTPQIETWTHMLTPSGGPLEDPKRPPVNFINQVTNPANVQFKAKSWSAPLVPAEWMGERWLTVGWMAAHSSKFILSRSTCYVWHRHREFEESPHPSTTGVAVGLHVYQDISTKQNLARTGISTSNGLNY